MDPVLGTKLAAVAAGLAVGAVVKHKTPLPHKVVGVPLNVAVGEIAVGVAGMIDPALGEQVGAQHGALQVAALVELTYQTGKTFVHGVRALGRLARRIF